VPSLKKRNLFLYSPPPLPYLIPWHPRKLIIYQILSKMTMKKQRTNALLTTLLPHYNQSCLQSIQPSINTSSINTAIHRSSAVHSYQQIHSLYSSNLYTPLHIRSIIHSSSISAAPFISVLPFSIQLYSLQRQFYIKRRFARNLTNLPQCYKPQ
jgi:hypothetical protein